MRPNALHPQYMRLHTQFIIDLMTIQVKKRPHPTMPTSRSAVGRCPERSKRAAVASGPSLRLKSPSPLRNLTDTASQGLGSSPHTYSEGGLMYPRFCFTVLQFVVNTTTFSKSTMDPHCDRESPQTCTNIDTIAVSIQGQGTKLQK